MTSQPDTKGTFNTEDAIARFIAELLGMLRAHDVPNDRAVFICQKTESFIAQVEQNARREERVRILVGMKSLFPNDIELIEREIQSFQPEK